MTPLEKRIDKKYRRVQKTADLVFQIYSRNVLSYTLQAGQDIYGILSAQLETFDQIDYQTVYKTKKLDQIQQNVSQRMDILADDLCTLWTKARRTYDIFGRVAVAYISDQATPPWYSPTLNLKDNLISKDGDLDPRKGRIHFKLAQLTDRIMSEVRRGALNKETPTEIIDRVKDLFPRPKTRESTWINVESAKKKKFGGGDLEIDYGTWSIEDLRDFVQQIRGANRWEHRIEKKGMPTSVTRRNKILQDLEQVLMTDAVNLLHQGEIQIGPKEMGIDDFVWKTHRQETTCPVCTKRDGKTMKWIRARIKDDFGDLAPPLHPNCNCELIPKISNEWSQKALKNMDEEWDSNTGLVYKANDLEKKYGAQDISFEEFVERFGV